MTDAPRATAPDDDVRARAVRALSRSSRVRADAWTACARAAAVRQHGELIRLQSVAARLGVPAPQPHRAG
ncbi:hypothetical protein [Kineococcus indalonis]|uniref:hypothetical protein n=1 Tax=Kineococcus indalonis TaxID=2696566 RepID=UPI001F0F7E95|nr:hypothetical protein [Kineococcus indalonis]